MRIFFGLICIGFGILLTITVLGAIIGIPLIAVGIWLVYSWQMKRLQRAIKGGIVEATRETAQKSNRADAPEETKKALPPNQ